MATPTIAFADLIRAVTQQEVENSIYRVLGTLGINTSSWKSGAVVRTITTAFAIVLSTFSELQALIAQSGYLDLSSGDWLTVVAHYVYGVDRYPATYATGFVTLTNSLGGVYSFDAEDLVFSNPITGKTYRNTAAVSIPAGSTGSPVDVPNVPIRATEAGFDSTSLAGTINTMVVTVTGVSVSNPSSVVGQDAESDAAVRARCSAKLGSLSPMGPWDAYTYAVRNATRPDGTNLGITRTRIAKDGYGNVDVFVATPNGAVVPDDVAIAQTQVELWAEPQCVNATVSSADEVAIAVTYELWMYNTSGNTNEQVKSLVFGNLDAWFQLQPIGGNVIGSDPGKIFVDKIRAIIGNTLPEIFHVVVTVPSGDTALALSDVAVPGLVTGIIHQEPPPEGFGV